MHPGFILLICINASLLIGAVAAIKYYFKRDSSRLNEIISAQDKISRSPFDLDKTLNLIVSHLQNLTRATGTAVELIDGDELDYRATSGSLKSFTGFRIKYAKSLSGLCIDTGEVIYSHDCNNDIRVNRAATSALGIRSMVVAPLVHEGKVIGVLKIASNKTNAFKKKDSQTMKLLANMIGAAISHEQDYAANQRLLNERSFMALHDSLTKLPNRSLFMEMLSGAIMRVPRSQRAMALFYLDLDGFKRINDHYGHQEGDNVLIQFAKKLQFALRETDFIARLGGDEFTVIVENLTNPKEDVKLIADKILLRMTEPFEVAGKPINLTTSIGIAICASGSRRVEDLIKSADSELYKAKHKGKNRFSAEKPEPVRQLV